MGGICPQRGSNLSLSDPRTRTSPILTIEPRRPSRTSSAVGPRTFLGAEPPVRVRVKPERSQREGVGCVVREIESALEAELVVLRVGESYGTGVDQPVQLGLNRR